MSKHQNARFGAALNDIRRGAKFGGWLATHFICEWCGHSQAWVIEIGPDDEIPLEVACVECQYLNDIAPPDDLRVGD